MISAAGFVLAGGSSTRMGRDKALIQCAGRPLIEHAIAALRQSDIPVAIAGDRSNLAAFAPVIADQEPSQGPLHGVCRALASTDAEYSVLVSVDTPLLPSSLFQYLLLHAQITGSLVTLPAVNGFPQTFPCVLRRKALPVFEHELSSGRAGCFAAFRAAASEAEEPLSVVPAELLAQAGHVHHPAGLPPAAWFLNVNTTEDLDVAQRWLAAAIA